MRRPAPTSTLTSPCRTTGSFRRSAAPTGSTGRTRISATSWTTRTCSRAVYTSELDRSAGGADPEVLIQDRLTKGRERLDNAVEAIAMLCEPVDPPNGELEHIHYFCGNTEVAEDLKEREPRRVAFYKAAAALVRAFANLADELDRAGYSEPEISHIKHA